MMRICDPRSASPIPCVNDPRKIQTTSAMARNPCLRHQAPRGWRYVNVGGRCVLQNTISRRIVQPTTTATQVINVTPTTIINGAKTWIQNNKGLAAVIAGVIVYAIGKNTK